MIESLDIEILKVINLDRIVELDGFFQLLSRTAPWIAGLIPVVAVLIGIIWKNPKCRMFGYRVATAYVLSVIISNILKPLIARPRPFVTYPFIQKLSSGGSGSFPSGHTSDVFAIATAVTLLYPTKRYWIPLFTWAAAVGYSRMDLGVHYPSDVLGGVAIGAGSAVICHWIFQRRLMAGSK
jgi:membrane-associated phospholipid phosphatase